jgi:hypothetical protein
VRLVLRGWVCVMFMSICMMVYDEYVSMWISTNEQRLPSMDRHHNSVNIAVPISLRMLCCLRARRELWQ